MGKVWDFLTSMYYILACIGALFLSVITATSTLNPLIALLCSVTSSACFILAGKLLTIRERKS